MRCATGMTLIHHGQLIDGTGKPPIPNGAVLIHDGRITYAGPENKLLPQSSEVQHIDARGGTIMPGLVEAHFHPTYFNVAALEDLDIKYPVEYVTLLAAVNARLALECGYTAARSGGSLFNIDVWLKKAIENDLIPGPRLAASGREICGVGGLMDWNPDFRKIGMEGLVLLINGADEARAAVRKLVKDGVEWVKTYPTGDAAAPDSNDHHTLCMTFEEMHAVVADGPQSRSESDRPLPGDRRGSRTPCGPATTRWSTALSWTTKRLELLLAAQYARVPALYFEHASIVARAGVRHVAARDRRAQGDARRRQPRALASILKAGGRLGMGGDYGFAWNPHGDYARELTFFVELCRL